MLEGGFQSSHLERVSNGKKTLGGRQKKKLYPESGESKGRGGSSEKLVGLQEMSIREGDHTKKDA